MKWVVVEESSGHWGQNKQIPRSVVKVGILAILDHLFVCDPPKTGIALSGAHEATGQLSGESRREGAVKDPRRVSGRSERVRKSVLHHQHHGRIGAHLSDEGLVGN